MSSYKVTMKGNPLTLIHEPVSLGMEAPEFTVLDGSLQPVSLASMKEKVIVITTFPSIDTEVCSRQVRKFNELATSISSDVAVVCVSCDLPFAQSRFCGANGIDKVLVVSDYKDVEVGEKYGLLINELRLLARAVVILDADRKVRYVEVVPEVTDEPNYDSAIIAIKEILG